MEHKQAANVLIEMTKTRRLSAQEKEALLLAVGVLAWTSLAQSRIRNLKAKRGKPPAKTN